MKQTTQTLLKTGSIGAVALALAACNEEPPAESATGTAPAAAETAPAEPAPAKTAAPAEPAANEIVFEPEFPKAMFVGTPTEAKLPNLETPGDPVLSLKVAEGTTLLSKGAPVTASDDLPTIGDLEYVTDGDKDGGDGYYVELGPDKQWVQIDLGATKQVEGITLWHFHKNARAYIDVVVQISDDATFASGVTTVYNNDHDNSSGLGEGKDLAYIETNNGRVIDTNGVNGRYVRLYSNGNTTDALNHYVEVEVYGK